MQSILENYHSVKNEIQAASVLKPKCRLVVVSKFQGADRIRLLLAEGHRVFGESRLEEALGKWPSLLQDFPDTKLHYIGALQSRKIKDIVRMFDVVQSIDRVEAAARIAREIVAQGRNLSCFIQVNIGREPQKSGVFPEHFERLFRQCVDEYALKISGVMCIPPTCEKPAPYFSKMKAIQERFDLPELSMGMSSDYLTAIEYGATIVRVGAKILGSR